MNCALPILLFFVFCGHDGCIVPLREFFIPAFNQLNSILASSFLYAIPARISSSHLYAKRCTLYAIPVIFLNSSSLIIFTPNSCAFWYFDPGSSPATT